MRHLFLPLDCGEFLKAVAGRDHEADIANNLNVSKFMKFLISKFQFCYMLESYEIEIL